MNLSSEEMWQWRLVTKLLRVVVWVLGSDVKRFDAEVKRIEALPPEQDAAERHAAASRLRQAATRWEQTERKP